MAEETGIGWCDSTFNPWVGCAKVSPGCANCYAETLVTGRMGRPGTWGETGVRQITSESNWSKPLRWDRDHAEFEAEHGHRRRVFCASLADVFEPRPELHWLLRRLFAMIVTTPNIDWLLLTKRPEIASDLMNGSGFWEGVGIAGGQHYPGRPWSQGYIIGDRPNLWIGTSVESSRYTWRVDELRKIKAAVRFVSCEPLISDPLQVIPRRFPNRTRSESTPDSDVAKRGTAQYGTQSGARRPGPRAPLDLTDIDWVIVGGESGKGARPMHLLWPLGVMNEADRCGSAFFMKQLGSQLAATLHAPGKGDDPEFFPASYRRQDFPTPRV